MSARRSSLGKLERLLRVVEPDACNLAHYLAEVGDDLAPKLGVEAQELHALAALPEEEAGPRLRALLRRRLEQHADRHGDIAQAAAQQLAATAVWKKGCLALDPSLLLGPLLADTRQKYIAFHARGAFRVTLPRSMLVNVANVTEPFFSELGAWVDGAGLHLRWRRGRGGLDLVSHNVPARESAFVLRVEFLAPVAKTPHPAPAMANAPRPAPSPAAPLARRSGGWFAAFLSELVSS